MLCVYKIDPIAGAIFQYYIIFKFLKYFFEEIRAILEIILDFVNFF